MYPVQFVQAYTIYKKPVYQIIIISFTQSEELKTAECLKFIIKNKGGFVITT